MFDSAEISTLTPVLFKDQIFLCVYVHTHICIYTHMYIYIHTYTYFYTHILVNIYYFYPWFIETHVAFSKFLNV